MDHKHIWMINNKNCVATGLCACRFVCVCVCVRFSVCICVCVWLFVCLFVWVHILFACESTLPELGKSVKHKTCVISSFSGSEQGWFC